jgi:hypothetical protein
VWWYWLGKLSMGWMIVDATEKLKYVTARSSSFSTLLMSTSNERRILPS